jgi:hypothetical protein
MGLPGPGWADADWVKTDAKAKTKEMSSTSWFLCMKLSIKVAQN